MQWRYAAVMVVLILTVSSLGCLSPPAPPPMSRMPKVIIDHVEQDDVFAVYVHGMSDYRYDRIEIRIDNESVYSMNHTFQGAALTNLTSFTLNITVIDLPNEGTDIDTYYYNATVNLVSRMAFTVEEHGTMHEIDLEQTTYYITTMYLAGKE